MRRTILQKLAAASSTSVDMDAKRRAKVMPLVRHSLDRGVKRLPFDHDFRIVLLYYYSDRRIRGFANQ